jgi:outer membrane protein assembly factor BamB
MKSLISRPKVWGTLALSLLLVACSKDKDIEPPAELVDFPATLQVDRVWNVSLGGGEPELRVGLSPASDGERVYAASRDGDVVAIDPNSGSVLWRSLTRAQLAGGPGAGAGAVALGTTNGDVILLDAQTGERKWQVPVGGEVLAAPAISAEVVVVRTVAGVLIGLSTPDGRQLWREDQQIPRLTLRGTGSPLIVDSTVVCGFDNGRVVAVDLRSGDILWDQLVAPARGRTELERLVDIDSAIKISGADLFVVSFQGKAAMLALDTGQAWWSRDISSHRGLDLDEDRMFVAGAEGAVIALARRSGTELWRQEGLRLRRLSAPAVIGSHVVVGDFEGYLHWLDVTDGRFAARVRAGDRLSNPPLVVGGTVIVQDDKGRVSAFRPRS